MTDEPKKRGRKPKAPSTWREEAQRLGVRVPGHPMPLTSFQDAEILTAEDWKYIYFAELGFMNQVAAIVANARARRGNEEQR